MADETNRPTRPAIPITAISSRHEHVGQLEISGPGAPTPEEAGGPLDPDGTRDPRGKGNRTLDESNRASKLLKELGEEFVRLRAENRTSAWAAYQRKIANNLHILVPNAIGLKDATSLLREIEEFMKTDAGASVLSPAEVVREWLNGSSAVTLTKRVQ